MTLTEVENKPLIQFNGKGYKIINVEGTLFTQTISYEDKKEIESYLEEQKKKFSNFKIKMEAIPFLTQKLNLARILPKKDWNKIRQETKDKYENKCGICKKSDVRLNCHEVWEFDEVNLIQSLKECIPLCTLCHMGIHPISASFESKKGYINLENVIEHFMKINECARETYDEYKNYIMDLEIYRINGYYSNEFKCKWRMNYGKYESLVKDKCGNINEKIDPYGLREPNVINTTENLDDISPVKMTFDELMNCDNKKHNNEQKSMMDF